MIPVQSSSSSPDVPHMGMSNGMFPMPPEHIMKQIIEDQQRFMQQMQNNQNEGNQEHIDHNHEEDNSRDDLDGDNDETDGWNEDMKPPSNLSMEEIQENLKHLLEDPEALKVRTKHSFYDSMLLFVDINRHFFLLHISLQWNTHNNPLAK